MAGNDSDGEELLAYPPGLALRRQIEGEELALRRDMPHDKQLVRAFPVRLVVKLES